MPSYDLLLEHADSVNELLARYGVKFGIYKNNTFKEQLFPFDAIPRIITHDEFSYLEKGLKQRVVALNMFLKDIYTKKQIVKDNVIPEDFIFASSGYMAECEGVVPVKDIYSHISGIDLVKGKNDHWYILEDNLRVPSGASYPMIARDLCRRAAPMTFHNTPIADNRNYAQLLRRTMDNVNVGGINVILTPGRYNSAYFEHSFLAEQTGSYLVNGSELTVENDNLYYITATGTKERVGAVYRRISDEYLDPMNFNPESLIGIPHIYDVVRKGNVALLNAPGNGVADDKGIYYFVPKMIRYYLNEEPILDNAPTYLPFYEEDMAYTLENFDNLVLKDVA
ncbi:MAG: circularly permuted type 2 ATP-grasp protein, partial [Lachnospiraceae bacterium]|nr:circularly permuted type 2 ATP-grasp protein [Lachnospiraceae bacterium]